MRRGPGFPSFVRGPGSASSASGGYPSPGSAAAREGATLRVQWTSQKGTPWGDFLAEAREALATALPAPSAFAPGRDAEADELLARTLRHGGLALDGRPLDPFGSPPRRVAAGTRVVLHALRDEPVPLALPGDAVLVDEEAAGLVAVAKPSGMPTQRTRASARLDLEHALRRRLDAPGLRAVHRIDRATSGLVLLARDARAAARLGSALRSQGLVRRYLAWVAPAPRRDLFRVAGWLGRVPDPARFRFALRAPAPGRHPYRRARWSATRFRVLHREGGRALVLAEPETGRTHQIRVHLASVGSPVLGDELYGAPAKPRLLLHALALRLRLPARAASLALVAPPPADFPLAAGLPAVRRALTAAPAAAG